MKPKLLSVEEQETYAEALHLLNESGIRYVVSGAVALGYYTGLWRNTKDLDLFLVQKDLTAALTVMATHGYTVGTPAPHWLANAIKGNYYVDLIHGFGGWRAAVDDVWYERGPKSTLLGQSVRVAPVEELIWIKSYVAHRERFDAADILHLIQACHQKLDWQHLIDRYGPCWEVLLFYLNLYEFAYPTCRSDIPAWVRQQFRERWRISRREPVRQPAVTQGTLLDRFSYLIDLDEGLVDGRLPWVEAQGYSERALAQDREEATQMVREGKVNPAKVA